MASLVSPIRRLFNAEETRERGIILQSNSRAAALAQWVGGVVTAVGIFVAVAFQRGVKFTPTSNAYANLAIATFILMGFSLSVVMWPQGLTRLPFDRTAAALEQRLREQAEAMGDSDTPTAAEYSELQFLQRVRTIKEWASRFTLVFLALFGTLAIATFATLQYK